MTTILSTKTNTFQFTDEFSDSLLRSCKTKITVEHQKYENNSEFYHIKYKHTYPSECKRCECNNPFHNAWGGGEEPYDCRNGDIIAVNEMTKSMINLLLLDMDKLEKLSGNRTPMNYKISIMKAITCLWD